MERLRNHKARDIDQQMGEDNAFYTHSVKAACCLIMNMEHPMHWEKSPRPKTLGDDDDAEGKSWLTKGAVKNFSINSCSVVIKIIQASNLVCTTIFKPLQNQNSKNLLQHV